MAQRECVLVKKSSPSEGVAEPLSGSKKLMQTSMSGFITPPLLSDKPEERRRQIQHNLTILDELEHSMQRAVIDALQIAAPHSQQDAAQMLVYLEWVEATRTSLRGLLWQKMPELT